MTCGCLLEPPTFDLPPPPDPSLIWHLISEGPFEPVEQCEQNPFVKINDSIDELVTSTVLDKYQRQLAALSILAVLMTLCICIAAFKKLTKKRTKKTTTKTISSDAILTAGDCLWTYNSMKDSNNPSGVFMYCDNSVKGSRNFAHTPATMRSYIGGTPVIGANGVPHSESTTLRMYPNDRTTAYHTVGRNLLPSEHYEEIAPVGTMTYNIQPRYPGTMARVSLRRPPPSCRPPPVPQLRNSDSSLEHELNRIPLSDSPPIDKIRSRGSLENGRESGYGTAPSSQWRSPPGSARDDSDTSRSPYVVGQSAGQLHSMTYV